MIYFSRFQVEFWFSCFIWYVILGVIPFHIFLFFMMDWLVCSQPASHLIHCWTQFSYH